MTKLCSVCSTENRDEAQFCRACGSAFAAAPAAPAQAADGSAANVCAECGFRNKAGIRYCANCGVNLAAPAAPEAGIAASPTPSNEAARSVEAPPVSYSSFASVAPYPQTAETDHSALFDEQTTPDIPDPAAAIALRRKEGQEAHGDTAATFADTPVAAPRRAGVVIAVVVALLVLGGIVAWL